MDNEKELPLCKNYLVINGKDACSCHKEVYKQDYINPVHCCNKTEDELYLNNLCLEENTPELILEELLDNYGDCKECEEDIISVVDDIERCTKELECINFLQNSSFNGFDYFEDNRKIYLPERKNELYKKIQNNISTIRGKL